jgi:hypothetical protein
MSLSRQYRPLFTVAAEDDLSNARLTAISFAATRACSARLADHQMVFRPRPGGFQVFFQTNPEAADPLMGRITARTRFSFAMTLSQRDLFARYQPDLNLNTGAQLYLDNLTPGGNIQAKNTLSVGTTVQQADAARVCPPMFALPVDLADPPAILRIRPMFPPGSPPREIAVDVPPGTGRALTRVDLSDLPVGPYALTADDEPEASTIYVDDELAARGALGVVDLYLEAAQDTVPDGGLAYFIRFARRVNP